MANNYSIQVAISLPKHFKAQLQETRRHLSVRFPEARFDLSFESVSEPIVGEIAMDSNDPRFQSGFYDSSGQNFELHALEELHLAIEDELKIYLTKSSPHARPPLSA
jgi:hypothetical protein